MKIGNAQLMAAFAQHVDGRTTRLICAIIGKSKKKMRGKNLHQKSIHVQNQIEKTLRCLSIQWKSIEKKNFQAEAFATLDIIILNRKGIHNLKAKVDTGVEGNTRSSCTFQLMFPEWVGWNDNHSSAQHKQKRQY